MSKAIPNLDAAAVNLSALREQVRSELCDALDSRRGKKALVLDPKLSGPLSLIAQTSLLKEHGVENLYYLEKDPIETECRHIIYLVRPRLELMSIIAHQVKSMGADNKAGVQHDHSVFFVPRRTIVCEKVLEEEGVYGDITFGELGLELIPYEEDVVSLELEAMFRECNVEGDTSSLFYVSRALHHLQASLGTIPNLKAKGTNAGAVVDMLKRLRRELAPDAQPSSADCEIDTLIIIDRGVDLYTPMCTQLTYEGLIDEVLHITNGAVEITTEGPGPGDPPKTSKCKLNGTDSIFRELRDLNFGRACDRLREKSIAIQADYRSIKGGRVEDQKVSDIKGFVKTVRDNMSGAGVDLHATIAKQLMDRTKAFHFMRRLEVERSCIEGYQVEHIFEYVEAMIYRQDNVYSVLRLLCLLSLTQGGFSKKQFDTLRREFLQSYGYAHLQSWNNLQAVGLVDHKERKQGHRTNFPVIRRGLKLVVDDMDDNNPNDIAYAYSHSGYAPLSVRLVAAALAPQGWKPVDDMLKQLPGPTIELTQTFDEKGLPAEGPPATAASAGGNSGTRKKPVLVFFLGGVTFAEISALRFISAQDEVNRDIIIGTTKLISGETLLEHLLVDSASMGDGSAAKGSSSRGIGGE